MTEERLAYRLRQQALISELGLCALGQRDFAALTQEATRIAAEGLRSRFAKVLEYLPEKNRFLVCAGVGWKAGVVGTATIGADLESPAGYALHTGRPVISNHLANEERFRTPALLVEHGVRRAINVIIRGTDAPYGVLEADSPNEGEFDEDDTEFLRALANVLAAGIERRQADKALARAVADKDALLREKQVLLDELNHRVTNNLQIISGLLTLEASRLADPVAQERLAAVRNRVDTLGRMHHHLYRDQSTGGGDIEFGAYLRELCDSLQSLHATGARKVTIATEAERTVIGIDRATPLALLANELVTNCVKHAFPEGAEGTVRVALRHSGDGLVLTVSDNGKGIEPPTESHRAGIGRDLVDALARQIGAAMETRVDHGTTVTVRVPQHAET